MQAPAVFAQTQAPPVPTDSADFFSKEHRSAILASCALLLICEPGLLHKLLKQRCNQLLGKTPLEGFLVCAGFSGHGFMHGPISGKLRTEIILDETTHTLDISMFDLTRFQEGRLIQEYNVV
jgi:hypothetical protein